MDAAYPQTPPSAHASARKIFHPTVDGSTGAVCVDTLKRDWSADLTLRHVLLTISCLLLCPNPASALNAEAGALLVEDQTAFERRAAMCRRGCTLRRRRRCRPRRRRPGTEASTMHRGGPSVAMPRPSLRSASSNNSRLRQLPALYSPHIHGGLLV